MMHYRLAVLNLKCKFILFGIVAGLTMHDAAYAYLDPGSVSLAVQAVVAGIAGLALTWKHWWYRLVNMFRFKNQLAKKSDQADDEEQATPDEKRDVRK